MSDPGQSAWLDRAVRIVGFAESLVDAARELEDDSWRSKQLLEAKIALATVRRDLSNLEDSGDSN